MTLDHDVTSGLAPRPAARTCEAFVGTLVAPCPNAGRTTAVVRGAERTVCPAHSVPGPRRR